MPRRRAELPPTAGLPISYSDFIRRPKSDFAAGLADWLSIPEPILTCSGTAAMVVALRTLRELNPARNEVVVPAYTCPLVALAPKLVPGLRVLACDTLPGGFDFDPEKLADIVTKKTLAVTPTHLGGRVADVGTAISIADKHGAAVLEDAAQALGARASGQSVGLAGDIGFFSLAAGKGLTTYEGGVLFSRDPGLHSRLRENAFRTLRPSFLWSARRFAELLGYAFFYNPSRLWQVYGKKLSSELAQGNEVEAVGDDFTLADIPLHSLDAARRRVAANALPRLPKFLNQGRERAALRIDVLKSLPGCSVLADSPGDDGVWPFFMLLLPSQESRDRALNRLWREGLGVSKLFVHVLNDYDFLDGSLENPGGSENARDLAARMLTVSNSHWLEDAMFERIVGEIKLCL